MNKNNKPEIRFKGFTDAWEQHNLEDIVDVYDGVHQTPDYIDKGIMFLSVENISTLKSEKYISEEAFNRDYKVYPEKGDILMTRIGDVGTPNVVETTEKVAFYVSLALLKPINVDSYFLCNSIISPFFQNGLKKRTLVTAIPQKINKDEIGKVSLYLSNLIDEQKKIGAFFRHFDNLITLHQRKLEKLQNIKKSMLEKMFPKDGNSLPEIRFKGFTDAWEQRKLIDVCDYVDYRGKTPVKTESGIFLVTAKNVKDGYIDYETSQEYISENDYEEVMYRGKPKIGDVLITTEAPCGNVAQVNRADIALAQRIIKYRGHSRVIDNTYLKYYLLSPGFQCILNTNSSGGTVQGIKGSILHQQQINYPKYEEQQAIGQFFNGLDYLITLHQRKLEKLKIIKKSMLEKMFVK
ncbi:restriction endonuclease subunit S [Thomasclavelia spiroformis]|uniref:restriction endonuclease subunit S n=1 Tax=Thomasclavelia spiroformis TaxID=29348 RepID=UPI00241E8F3F|nr:restriction endonuclease subunit S [Thomasclavelia spiroformis]MBS6115078.1 restriction endonuclease subunit S [Thomasclavelia spiroformis]